MAKVTLLVLCALASSAFGKVFLKLDGTNKCLDLTGGSDKNGAMLEIWDCNGLQNQMWVFGAGTWAINWAGDTSKCIDNIGGGGAGNKLGIWQCNGQDSQKWGYDSNMKTIYLASSKSLQAKANSSAPQASLCIDIPGGNTDNGNAIQIWGCNGKANQKWSVANIGPSPGPGPAPPSPPAPPGGGCYAKNGIDAQQLSCVYPNLGSSKAQSYANDLNSWMGDSLTNACKWAALLANVGTESAGLTTWTQIPCNSATAAPYCGRGPLQITGYNNYHYCEQQSTCKCPGISSNAAKVSDDENTGWGTTSCVWKTMSGHDLSRDADGSEEGLRKTACYINAGHYPCSVLNGWESRKQYWYKANQCLGISLANQTFSIV